MREIPKRNYLILSILFIVIVLLTIYVSNVIKEYRYYKVGNNSFETQVSAIKINEIELALSELNEVILYVPYTNRNKSVRELESNLLKEIKDKNIENYFYYLNISSEIKKGRYLKTINKKITNDNKLKKSPALIYIKHGKIIEVVDSKKNLITTKSLDYLLDKYEIGK